MAHFTFENVAVLAVSRDEPWEIASSASLEEQLAPLMARLRLPAGLLASMTGITSRGFYPLEHTSSRIAAQAAEILFKKTGFNRERLELLLSTSVCRDFIEPSTASIVHSRLGLSKTCRYLDIGNACLGFMDGLEIAALQIETGRLEYALVVTGENSRPVVENTLATLRRPQVTIKDFFRNFATLTLGSGGAAALIGPADRHPDKPRLLGGVNLGDTTTNHLCRGNQSGMETDAAAMMAAGVILAQDTFRLGREKFGWKPQDFDSLICHQVSAANIKKLCQALDLPEERLVKTYPSYGNMGPAAIPFTYDLARERGRLGRRSLWMGIGSGLACLMMELALS